MDRDTAEDIKSEFRRQVGVLNDGFQSRLDLVVEGQQDLRRELGDLRREFDTFRADVRKEFEETRETIRLSHGEHERRIVDLETGTS